MFDKFHHSVKVPRLYKVAATIAKQFSEGVGSIKDLVYGGKKKHPVSILEFIHKYSINTHL